MQDDGLQVLAEGLRFPEGPIAMADGSVLSASLGTSRFDSVVDRLEQEGLPIKADRDQAWRDFAGWRVNYDTVLIALADLTMAPYAPWSSDRSTVDRRHMSIPIFARPKADED